MRIAICFSGQLRTAVHAAPAIKKWIGDLWENCDFFMHTWNINSYSCGIKDLPERVKLLANIQLENNDNNYRHFYVNNHDVELASKFYNLKSLIVDDYFSIRDCWLDDWKKNYLNQFHLNNQFYDYWKPLHYSFSRSIELKSNYEKIHNFKYDMVLKLRLDTSFPLESGCIEMIKGQEDHNVYYKQTSLLKEVEIFNSDSTKFYAESKEPGEAFWYGNSNVMDVAALYSGANIKENLGMKEYLSRHNIEIGKAYIEGPLIGYHRVMVTDCPSDDWPLIYMLDRLFAIDSKFLNVIETQLNHTWHSKLAKALIDYNAVKNFCKIYGLSFTIG